MNANGYRLITWLLLATYPFFGLWLIVAAMSLVGRVLSGGWFWVAAIVGGFILLALVTHGWILLHGRRVTGYFARLFPGHAGERFPIFSLLHAGGEGGAFAPDGRKIFSIAVADEHLFLLCNDADGGARRSSADRS
jgi:hypothetical protein